MNKKRVVQINNMIRERRNAMANDFVSTMFELESNEQKNWIEKYEKFNEYLLTLYTEKELIEKLVVIENCHCCIKHSIHKTENVKTCSCKCKHFRDSLYECLTAYSKTK